ncbi:TIGR01777 family oxidoreductase [Methylomonas sp. SURF-2]|uniref:TIGR01777 family oxidoreductase n=1 Tax=Methylomonas subterranea TaxID=2952225 RepID=A0ABT1TBL7_9GAMM|nr:TIGR01777 family oxidoreductase [Methylomonas sp. SURF-2]MCQ8102699.1 TIGR01777 family oxidoreductase [Methylomonas sp. SURF-2]
MTDKPVLITGGTGFLGSALTFELLRAQRDVTIFSRDADKVRREFGTQVRAVTRMDQLADASGFKAVVNLAGAGIFDRRWSEARKRLLRESRIGLTRDLVDWIKRSEGPPEVLISGSAIGFYGDCGDTLLTEQSQPRVDFAQRLCADWEQTALSAAAAGTRVCLIRTGLVLGPDGGLLKRMLPPFRFGLGGRLGRGGQWMSWIHLRDWIAIVLAMMDNPEMQGAYNATAPNPVTNRVFSATLAGVLNRPLLLPLPEFLLKLLLGEMAALLLGSQRVMPDRLLSQGHVFQFGDLDAALRDILLAN